MKNRQHRHFFIISGQYQWAISQAKLLLKNHSKQVWITDQPIPALEQTTIPACKATSLLGQEASALVYDTFCGFNIDAFGLTSGIVCGGGSIILLTPDLKLWSGINDPENQRLFSFHHTGHKSFFIERTVHLIKKASHATVITPDTSPDPTAKFFADKIKQEENNSNQKQDEPFCAVTTEQAQAVKAIVTLHDNQKRNAMVLTADRGRGKSSALGLAAAWIVKQATSFVHIIVTAPKPATVESLFFCARKLLADHCTSTKTQIHHPSGTIRFVAPDLLTDTLPVATILLVDEAAAIPVPLLKNWLKHYRKVVFSTTIHGYEGTGRGFAVRFQTILQASYPHYNRYHINEPVRWAPGDPAEQLIFNMLGLNSVPSSDEKALSAYQQGYKYITFTQEILLHNDNLLLQIFGLLIISHYQTRPSDFRRLLDAPEIKIHAIVSSQDSKMIVLGVALTFNEMPVDSHLHSDIYLGKRRLRGSMLPQLLATQCNCKIALSARCARIQRIAIHPALQSVGLGSRLLFNVIQNLKQDSLDYVGSNFGATAYLLSFWQKNDFSVVSLSSRCDASSACHAATVIYPLSETGIQVKQQTQSHFFKQLPYSLKEPLKHLDLSVCIALLTYSDRPSAPVIFSADEKASIHAYAHGYRLYDYVVHTLHKALWYIVAKNKFSLLNQTQQFLIIMKVAQGHSWDTCIQKLHFSGKKEAYKKLREAYAPICNFLI